MTVCNELSHCQSEEFLSTVMDNADKVPTNLTIIATNAGTLGSWQHRWRENYREDRDWFFQKVAAVAPWIERADGSRRQAAKLAQPICAAVARTMGERRRRCPGRRRLGGGCHAGRADFRNGSRGKAASSALNLGVQAGPQLPWWCC